MGDENLEELIKRAHTEAVFRDVNERIAESAERFDSETTEFVCECADPSCADRVEATLEQYESVRDESTTFLLVPGHEDTQIERVVEKFDRVVARTVRRLDPRAEPA